MQSAIEHDFSKPHNLRFTKKIRHFVKGCGIRWDMSVFENEMQTACPFTSLNSRSKSGSADNTRSVIFSAVMNTYLRVCTLCTRAWEYALGFVLNVCHAGTTPARISTPVTHSPTSTGDRFVQQPPVKPFSEKEEIKQQYKLTKTYDSVLVLRESIEIRDTK